MTIKELLGTSNKEEQEARIKELLAKEASAQYGMLIKYDQKLDGVDVHPFGGNVPFDVLYRMLELANKAVRQEEIEMAKEFALLDAKSEEK